MPITYDVLLLNRLDLIIRIPKLGKFLELLLEFEILVYDNYDFKRYVKFEHSRDPIWIVLSLSESRKISQTKVLFFVVCAILAWKWARSLGWTDQ